MRRLGLAALPILALSISSAFALPSPREAYEHLRLDKDFNTKEALQLILDHPGDSNNSPATFDEQKRTLARSVGLLVTQDAKTGTFENTCTGAMISADYFLTASHCAHGPNQNYYVLFGFQKESGQDQPKITRQRFAGAFRAEARHILKNSDAMILKLAGAPGLTQGWLKLSSAAPQRGDKVFAIHHPHAEPLTLSHCILVHSERFPAESFFQRFRRIYDLRANCDVSPGSSGGPLLNENGEIIGIARYMDWAITGHLFNGIINISDELEKSRRLKSVREALGAP